MFLLLPPTGPPKCASAFSTFCFSLSPRRCALLLTLSFYKPRLCPAAPFSICTIFSALSASPLYHRPWVCVLFSYKQSAMPFPAAFSRLWRLLRFLFQHLLAHRPAQRPVRLHVLLLYRLTSLAFYKTLLCRRESSHPQRSLRRFSPAQIARCFAEDPPFENPFSFGLPSLARCFPVVFSCSRRRRRFPFVVFLIAANRLMPMPSPSTTLFPGPGWLIRFLPGFVNAACPVSVSLSTSVSSFACPGTGYSAAFRAIRPFKAFRSQKKRPFNKSAFCHILLSKDQSMLCIKTNAKDNTPTAMPPILVMLFSLPSTVLDFILFA